MTISFKYRESGLGDDMLAITTNQHINVEFLFDKGEDATHVYLDGHEFPVTEEMLNGIFVGIGEKMVSLVELCAEANRSYLPIVDEIRKEAREFSRAERELCSPRATGRI
jgi:hypothetical protein